MAEDTLQTAGLNALRSLSKRFGARLVLGIVPLAFGTATIVLGIVGWSLKLYDGSLHSIGEIAFSASSEFAPSVKNLEGGNKITVLAALMGLLTLYSSLIAVLARLFREQRRKLLARHVHRGHPVVIGSTRLAQRAVDLWRAHDRRALQVVPVEETLLFRRPVVRHALASSLVDGLALWRAGRIFIDAGEDACTLRLALELFAALATRGPPPPHRGDWVVVLARSDYAEHLAIRLGELRMASRDPRGMPSVHVLRPERLIARQIMAAKPPFLQVAPGARLHAVLIGFDPLGEEMLEAFFQLAMVADRPPAMATVLVASAATARSRFFAARPALEGTIDIAFLDADALDDFQACRTAAGIALRDRDVATPVTVVYLTAVENDGALPAVMLIRAIRRRTGRLIAPSFIRAGDDDETVSWRALFGSSPPDDFSEFGLSDAFLDTQLSAPAARDKLARALHEQYLPDRVRLTNAGVDWEKLPENLRIANCNAADHCLAKMHSLGFDVGGLPAGVLPRLDAADAQELLAEDPDGLLLRPLLRLEHERWACERRFGGWVQGEERDDDAQCHPLLVPWDELLRRFPEEVSKDRAQITGLIRCLAQTGDPNHVLLRRERASPDTPAPHSLETAMTP